jgi:hypothetical protein
LRRIDASDQAVVLLDVDIVPQAWWLSALVSSLVDGVADIVTGYRWLLIEEASLAGHVLAPIDRSNALLPRAPFSSALWGERSPSRPEQPQSAGHFGVHIGQ